MIRHTCTVFNNKHPMGCEAQLALENKPRPLSSAGDSNP